MSTEPVVGGIWLAPCLRGSHTKTPPRRAVSPSWSPQPLQVGPEKEGDFGREQPSLVLSSPQWGCNCHSTRQRGALCQELDTWWTSGPSSPHGAHPILNFCRSAKCADTFKGGRKLWGVAQKDLSCRPSVAESRLPSWTLSSFTSALFRASCFLRVWQVLRSNGEKQELLAQPPRPGLGCAGWLQSRVLALPWDTLLTQSVCLLHS